MNNNKKNGLSRRMFLGQAALTTAATAGLGTINLVTTQQVHAGWFDKTTLPDPEAPQPIASHYPAVVVGSGYGGSVAALRLGEAGIDTLMIEMGKLWQTPASDNRIFCPVTQADGRAMWFKTRTEAPLDTILGLDLINRNIDPYPGVLDRVNFPNMSVYLGRGVGGGSLVNGCMAVTPRRDYLQALLPQLNLDALYQRWFPLANRMLGTSRIPDALLQSRYYQFTRTAQRTAHRAGYRTLDVTSTYDFNYMQQEVSGAVPQSALDGEVIYGNNGGKRSLDKNYIPAALGTGHVTLRTLTEVTDIEPLAGIDGYRLTLKTIDGSGAVQAWLQVTCDQLFLGAGSVGTTQMLVRARERGTLPNLSTAVGQGWGPNGNIMMARGNRWFDTTGSRQSTMPVMGIDAWQQRDGQRVFAEIAPLPTGFENWTSLYLALSDSRERGQFVYNPTQDRADLIWGAQQSAAARTAALAVFDRINDANRTEYRRGLFRDNQPWADYFTYHPLGGCVLGEATNAFGAVHGYDHLYVVDGSLLPGSVGVNPYVTITALAERNMASILQLK